MPVRTAVIGYICIALVAILLVATDALQTADHAILDTQFKAPVETYGYDKMQPAKEGIRAEA